MTPYLIRDYGRAFRGKKVEDVKRGRKYTRLHVVAGQFRDARGHIRHVAPFCYSQPMNCDLFETWFRTQLVKSIARGSTVIMDRASFHRKKTLENLARRHHVKILFLPAYSPDFNPIEKTWANMKKTLIDLLPAHTSLQNAILQYLDCNHRN